MIAESKNDTDRQENHDDFIGWQLESVQHPPSDGEFSDEF